MIPRGAAAACLLAAPVLVAQAPPAGGEPGRDALFRVWTPVGRAPAAAEQEPSDPCAPPGMPVILETPYAIELLDEGDTIRMRFEEWDVSRTIYMRPGKGPPVQDHSPQGVSFGRWEGATLAVFTTYIDYPFADAAGTPQSRDATVLERYTPRGDSTLEWRITLTDPSAPRQPAVRTGLMVHEAGRRLDVRTCAASPPAD